MRTHRPRKQEARPGPRSGAWLYGRHAIQEALSQPGQVRELLLSASGHGNTFREIERLAQAQGVAVVWRSREQLDQLVGPVVHQGVVAQVAEHRYVELQDLLELKVTPPDQRLLVVADEIEDPRNLGAIVRSAEAAGAHGMVIPERRSAELTPGAMKTAGGAAIHLPVARIGNLVQALQRMQSAGLWTVGLDGNAPQTLWEADLKRPIALLVGSEDKGLRRLTREHCDLLVRIPMWGRIDSLNASVAAGIVLFEIQRQRQRPAPPPVVPKEKTV